jgi:hypothetical protein
MCEKNGVKLIEIPYTVHVKDLYPFIIEACNKMEINIPVHENIDIKEITGQYSKNELVELNKLALAHGGKLLSRSYLGVATKLKWQCSKDHTWEAMPNGVKRGSWCPYCYGKIKLTIVEMQEIAKKRSGLCLSEEYINSKTKLKWQCAKGHVWENTPGHIKNGQWCDKCARAKRKNKL